MRLHAVIVLFELCIVCTSTFRFYNFVFILENYQYQEMKQNPELLVCILGIMLVRFSLARPPDEQDYYHQELVSRDHYYSYPDPEEVQTPLELEGEVEVPPEPIIEVIHESQDTREDIYPTQRKNIIKSKKMNGKEEKAQKPGIYYIIKST